MSNQLECEPLPSSVRRARLFVVDKLQEWRCDDLVDRAALLTSELATNAVIHTGMPYAVRVERTGATVRVEVADRVEEVPTRPRRRRLGGPAVGSGAVDGLSDSSEAQMFSGLGIVDATATSWGSEPVPGGGKIVWFELAGEQPDAASEVRSARLRDLREASPSPLSHDLDRPLDAWVLALGGPRLSHAVRMASVILLVLLVLLLVVLFTRG